MTQRSRLINALVASVSLFIMPIGVAADDDETAYRNITETYGFMPVFFSQFPRDQLANLWRAFSDHQMNPDLGMDGGSRELIGIAIAAQSSCQTCLYFHVAAALANGASEDDILAAINVTEVTVRLHSSVAAADIAPREFRWATDLVLWGDASTVVSRSLSSDSCQRLASAKVQLAGFCQE